MNDNKLKQRMTTYNQQTATQQKATAEMALAALGQNMETLREIAEEVRPIYELSKSMPADEFNQQLRLWCDGDEKTIEATINMISLIDDWFLLE